MIRRMKAGRVRRTVWRRGHVALVLGVDKRLHVIKISERITHRGRASEWVWRECRAMRGVGDAMLEEAWMRGVGDAMLEEA